jgi:hypothetical protein
MAAAEEQTIGLKDLQVCIAAVPWMDLAAGMARPSSIASHSSGCVMEYDC